MMYDTKLIQQSINKALIISKGHACYDKSMRTPILKCPLCAFHKCCSSSELAAADIIKMRYERAIMLTHPDILLELLLC